MDSFDQLCMWADDPAGTLYVGPYHISPGKAGIKMTVSTRCRLFHAQEPTFAEAFQKIKEQIANANRREPPAE